MKVILREAIDSLGTVGEEVTVAKGYARNYLLPQRKAVLATPANRGLIERERQKLELKAAENKDKAAVQAKSLEGVVCTISAKVSDEDRLYGSVGTRDIQDQLKAQDLEIDRKCILLSEPIKSLGTYPIVIQLHPEVRQEITVTVVAEE